MLEPEPELGVMQGLCCVHFSFSVEKDNAGGNIHGMTSFLQREDTKT